MPVFLTDVKGDLAAACMPGRMCEGIKKRIDRHGLPEVPFTGFPCAYWDVFGQMGLSVRTKISEMGPTLFIASNGVISGSSGGVMDIVFRIADDKGLLLLDSKDLRAMLA